MGRQTVTYLSALYSETHPSAETFCGTLKIDMEKTLKPSRKEKSGEDRIRCVQLLYSAGVHENMNHKQFCTLMCT